MDQGTFAVGFSSSQELYCEDLDGALPFRAGVIGAHGERLAVIDRTAAWAVPLLLAAQADANADAANPGTRMQFRAWVYNAHMGRARATIKPVAGSPLALAREIAINLAVRTQTTHKSEKSA